MATNSQFMNIDREKYGIPANAEIYGYAQGPKGTAVAWRNPSAPRPMAVSSPQQEPQSVQPNSPQYAAPSAPYISPREIPLMNVEDRPPEGALSRSWGVPMSGAREGQHWNHLAHNANMQIMRINSDERQTAMRTAADVYGRQLDAYARQSESPADNNYVTPINIKMNDGSVKTVNGVYRSRDGKVIDLRDSQNMAPALQDLNGNGIIDAGDVNPSGPQSVPTLRPASVDPERTPMREPTEADRKAMEFLINNPNHPKASQIKERLKGVRPSTPNG